MATIKTYKFNAQDGQPAADAKATAEVEVIHDSGNNADGKPGVTRWAMTPAQAVKHDAQFRTEMAPPDQAKLDALKGG